MTGTHRLNELLIAFVAGFLAVVVFHQITVLLLSSGGLIPGNPVPWAMDPVPPFGVPTLISKAFWGGVWAAAFAPLFRGTRGLSYWGAWTLLGAVALPLVAIFVVPPLKGKPVPDLLATFPVYALINAVWGFGTALILRMLGRG